MIASRARLLAPALALGVLAGCSGGAQTGAQTADFVFTNGAVYTVEDDSPWAEAVAVRGNEIIYVGDAAGAEALVGDGTERIDLDGKMMLPGYVSTHDHIIGAASWPTSSSWSATSWTSSRPRSCWRSRSSPL